MLSRRFFWGTSKDRTTGSIAKFIAMGLSLFIFRAVFAAEGTVTFEVLTPKAALQAAQAALEDCRASGYQVAVAVVDRFGGIQVVVRDQLAAPRTVDTAVGKARTAAGFRTNTTEIVAVTEAGTPQAGIRNLPGVTVIGGGMIIEAAGTLVGGIGVSGAPGPHLDDECAQAGIDDIEDLLEF